MKSMRSLLLSLLLSIGLLFACSACVAPAISSAESLGPQLVDNGTFDTADGWTLGYSWQILPAPGALAFHNEGYTAPIEQATAALSAGTTYRVSYTISGTYAASDPRHWFRLRGSSGFVSCPIYSGDGTFTCDLSAPAGVSALLIRPVYGFSGVLDDVSVREVIP